MSKQKERTNAAIEELKEALAKIAELEGEPRLEELRRFEGYIASVEQSRKRMLREQAEIDRLKEETRSMISKMMAA